MAPPTIRTAIKNCLKNLTAGELEEFKDALITEKGVPTSSVEGKNFLDVTRVIDTTFSDEALNVVIELLNGIDCKKKADTLVAETKELTSNAGSSKSAGASAGTDRVTPEADVKHFVDKHQCDLIARVSNIGPILDNLLREGVIQQEDYDTIRTIPTTQDRMRKLFSGPLKAGGQAAKDVFFRILEVKESYLVADLKRKET